MSVPGFAPLGVRAMAGPIDVTVDVYPPDRRRRDIDNLQKGLFDALQYARIYGDDSQIERFTVERRAPTPGGRVIVTIREYGGTQ